MLELRHITKRFGPLTALDDVSLPIPPGAVLGLLGENGAGKSTLTQILFGMVRPDDGTIAIDGREVHMASPRMAHRLGIGMVHQHFKLVPTLTGLENLRLFIPGSATDLRRRMTALLARLHWSVPLEQPVETLAVGQQQRIEITKALLAMEAGSGGGNRPGTLILDEPTAVLTPQETAELFAALRTLRQSGAAIVFISHKLGEVTQICDELAILRRGRLVHRGPVNGLSTNEMAQMMVGTAVALPHLTRPTERPPSAVVKKEPPAELLALHGICTDRLRHVSLSLRAGEVLGIAGVDGNGQSHLAQVILGTLTPDAGEVRIGGRPAGTLRQRLDRIAFIAEDRQREALVLPLSVEDNLLLKDYRTPRFSTLGWLRTSAWRARSRALMTQFDIRAPGPSATTGRLSGGNQQKVVLARELGGDDNRTGTAKSIVLAVNPTRGLDVGATAFVLQRLLDARARGAGVLLIHTDLDELLSVSDQISVLYNGTLTDAPEPSKEIIGRLMAGLPAAPPPRPQPRPAQAGGEPQEGMP